MGPDFNIALEARRRRMEWYDSAETMARDGLLYGSWELIDNAAGL